MYTLQNVQFAMIVCCIALFVGLIVKDYTDLIQEVSGVFAVAVYVAIARKSGTIILSYLIFPKPVEARHIFSLLLIFTAILLDIGFKKKTNNNNNNNNNNNYKDTSTISV